jgi:co-chaperonin GroES (HSP10)
MKHKKAYMYTLGPDGQSIEKFPVTPVGDWIIIERIPVIDEQTKRLKKTNLLLGSGKQTMTYENAEDEFVKMWSEHPFQGIVKAIGDGRNLSETSVIPIDLEPGDHIMYRSKSGEPIVVDSKVYWMIKEHDIFGVYNK